MKYALPHSIHSGYAQADILTEEQDPFVNWTERGGALVEALPGAAEIAEAAKRVPPMGWAFGAGILAGVALGIKPLVLGGVAWMLLAPRTGNGAVSGYGREAPGATLQENVAMMKDPEIAASVAERSANTFIAPKAPYHPGHPATQMNLLLAGGVGVIALAGFFLLRKRR
jgi:LPXTG-motif cell wall-anchored protein